MHRNDAKNCAMDRNLFSNAYKASNVEFIEANVQYVVYVFNISVLTTSFHIIRPYTISPFHQYHHHLPWQLMSICWVSEWILCGLKGYSFIPNKIHSNLIVVIFVWYFPIYLYVVCMLYMKGRACEIICIECSIIRIIQLLID